MKTNNLILSVILLFASVSFVGCFGVSDEFHSIKYQILKETDGNYKKEFEFSVGSIGLSMARTIVDWSDDDEEASEMLRHISNVQVGIYKLKNKSQSGRKFTDYHHLISMMEQHGWHYIVRSFDHDKASIIFIKNNKDDRFRDLFIVAVEHNKLNLVEVHGNLDKVVEVAIRDKDLKMNYTKK